MKYFIISLFLISPFINNAQSKATPLGVNTSPYLWVDEVFEWSGLVYQISRFPSAETDFGSTKYKCNNIITLFFLPNGSDEGLIGFSQNGIPFGGAYNGDTKNFTKNDKVKIKAKVLTQVTGTVILEILEIEKIE